MTENSVVKEKRDIGYCCCCRDKRYMRDVVATPTKNDRALLRGHCTICGSRVSKIGAR